MDPLSHVQFIMNIEDNGPLNYPSQGILLENTSKEIKIFKTAIEFHETHITENKQLQAIKIEALDVTGRFLVDFIELLKVLSDESKIDKASLLQAYIEKNVALFKKNPYLIDVSPSVGPFKGQTPLLVASSWRFFDLVRDMLYMYPAANINATPAEGDCKGITPLWCAAYNAQWELVYEMLRGHPEANINATQAAGNCKGITPLWHAVNCQQWELVLEMLRKHPSAYVDALPAEGSQRGATLFLSAAFDLQWELVSEILSGHPNIDINAASVVGPQKGATLLWCAAVGQQWELVRKILRNYPEVNVHASRSTENDLQLTPYNVAMHFKQFDIAQEILRLSAEQKEGKLQTRANDRIITDKLRFEPAGKQNALYKHIGKSSPVSRVNVLTNLLGAVKNNKTKEVKKILCKGALESKVPEVLQALSLAIEQGSYETAVYLFERLIKSPILDAKCILFDCYRLTKMYRQERFMAYLQQQKESRLPLMICSELYKALCNEDMNIIVNFILEYADLLDLTNYNRLLVVATRSGKLFILQFLLDVYFKDLNLLAKVKNERGQTLLHVAVSYGQPAIAQVLIEACPDLLKIKDSGNCTATLLAMRSQQRELAKVLAEAASKASVQLPQKLQVSSLKAKKASLKDFLAFMEKGDLSSVMLYYKQFGKSVDAGQLFESTIKSGALNILAYFLNSLTLKAPEYALAVHMAAEYGKLDIIKYLIKSIPEKSMVQEVISLKLAGKTCLHVAAKSCNVATIKYLLSISSDLCLEIDDQGYIAEEIAFTHENLEIYNYLKSCATGLKKSRIPKDLPEVGLGEPSPLLSLPAREVEVKDFNNINEKRSADTFNVPNESNEGYLEEKDAQQLNPLEATLETSKKIEKTLYCSRKTLERRPSAIKLHEGSQSFFLKEVKPQKDLPLNLSERALERPKKLEKILYRSRKTLEKRPSAINLHEADPLKLNTREASLIYESQDGVASGQTEAEKRKGKLEKKSSVRDLANPILTRKSSQPAVNTAEGEVSTFLSAKKTKIKKLSALSKVRNLWHGDNKAMPSSSAKSILEANCEALSENSQESYGSCISEMPSSSVSQSQEGYATCEKLIKFLAKCNVEAISDIKLKLSVVKATLRSLQKQQIIEHRLSNNTLSATKINNPAVHLTVHTHNDYRAWYQKPEFTRDFFKFVCECDSEVDQQVKSLGFLSR